MHFSAFILAPSNGKISSDWIQSVLYRSCYKKQSSPHGHQVYLGKLGDPYGFEPEQYDDDDIAALPKVADIYGGEHVAMRVYGGGLLLYLVKSGRLLKKPTTEMFCFRLQSGSDGDRSEHEWLRLQRWFENSKQFGHIDLDQMKALYDAHTLDWQKWFELFGIEGVEEMDMAAYWADVRSYIETLLRGDVVDKKLAGRVRECVVEETVPVKPKKSVAATANVLFDIYSELEDTIGEPPGDDTWWSLRQRAANMYDAIVDSPSRDMLAIGNGKKGLGESAAIGRLLAHYPRELQRDPFVMTAIYNDVEAWNGHCYTPALTRLIGECPESGFTLAIYPTTLREAFNSNFGLTFPDGDARECDGWTADAFIDTPRLLKADAGEALAKWFAKQRGHGLVVRAESSGGIQTTWYSDGSPSEQPHEHWPWPADLDATVAAAAATALYPRDIFAALNMPDLLEPGEFTIDEHRSVPVDEKELRERAEAKAMLDDMPSAETIANWEDMRKDLPHSFDYKDHDWTFKEAEQGVFGVIAITIPSEDMDYLRALLRDFDNTCYGSPWLDGSTLYNFIRPGYPNGILELASFLPRLDGLSIACDIKNGKVRHYVLRP